MTSVTLCGSASLTVICSLAMGSGTNCFLTLILSERFQTLTLLFSQIILFVRMNRRFWLIYQGET